jgi:hypothetical protein
MLNELYTFAEPVQVVPFSNLKWGKFTLLHTIGVKVVISILETTTSIRRLATAEFAKRDFIYSNQLSQIFELKSQNRDFNSLLCEIFTYMAVKIEKSGIQRIYRK